MKQSLWVLLVLMFIVEVASAQEVRSPGFGKGILQITTQDSTFSMNFSGRFQGLYTSTWDRTQPEGGFIAGSRGMSIRRARLKFDGFAYSPRLRYKMEIGLSNRDISGASVYTSNTPRYILDAVIQWNFYRNFELWAGQTKLPGNRERVISSGNLQFVDRSLLNSRFNIDRDIGLQLRHHFNPTGEVILREMLALSQGEGRNITTGNLGGLQYTARVEVLPFGKFTGKGDYSGGDLQREASPKLSVAAGFDHNADAVRTRSNSGSYMLTDAGFHKTDITTLFIDAMFKYRGFSFMGEYSERNADDPIALNADRSPTGDIVNVGTGMNFQAGYLLKNYLEISGRYTNIDLDPVTNIVEENQYTIGISKYFSGHKLKIQTDLGFTDLHNTNNDEILFRLQFDIHF